MPVKLNSTGGGSVTLTTPSTASDFTQTLPAGNGTILTTAGVTTPVEFAAGTAALPSITTTGDTNTGAFFPAADVVAVATGGSERLRVAASGQIGIGGANYGTSGQVLTSGGSGAAPSWTTISSTGALKNVQVFTSSGTYTRTAGVTTAVVIAVGGGGGGAAVNNTGGASGTGSTGGTTSFGSHVSAAGGSGGTTTAGNVRGGAGGTGGTGATIAIKGSPGAWNSGGGQGGGVFAAAGTRGGGGGGGFLAQGGCGFNGPGAGGGGGEMGIKYTTTVGATETVTIGGGGAGATDNGSNGGAGGAGYVIVYEYS